MPENVPQGGPETKEKKSPLWAYIVMSVLVVACIALAFFLGRLMIPSGPPIEDIVRVPQNPPTAVQQNGSEVSTAASIQNPEMEPEPYSGLGEEEGSDESSRPPRLAIDGMEAQVFALSMIAGTVSSYRLSRGRYPASIDEMIAGTGFLLPGNPYSPGTAMLVLSPGDFSPGGFSYLTFGSLAAGEIEGFILVGYAETLEAGVTISDPGRLIEPSVFVPGFDVGLEGVSVAMREGGALIELSGL